MKNSPSRPFAWVCAAAWLATGSAFVRADERGAERHWSFAPLARPELPTARGSDHPVDRFVDEVLAREGLTRNEPETRVTLVRRLTLDLLGIPPTLGKIDAFLGDDSDDDVAFERLVDRLLSSPRFGERWGRHWLDLARYADSSGFHNDLDRPHAWRYRDYVVASFNEDRPYGEFVRQQIAGDETPNATLDDWVATGFCRNGPNNDDNMGKTKLALEQYRLDELDDVIATTSSVFLGLTLGCARCHDHEYDPISLRDYYRFLAFFDSGVKRSLRLDRIDSEKPTFEKHKPGKPTKKPQAMVFTTRDARTRETFVLLRGQAQNRAEKVDAGVPALFGRESMAPRGTRSELAEWITSHDHPLTWRVLANRIWQHLFGEGLVTTPSDFGQRGARPTHPELLDYLANELRTNGGSVKSLVRLVVTSSTYRQSSKARPDAMQKDPLTRLLWRQRLRLLEAEALRDSILAVAGSLNERIGGPGVKPRMLPDLLSASQRNKWPVVKKEGPEHWRRSVYVYVKRQLRLPLLELFDAPSGSHTCAKRPKSLVPTQSLILMNDSFVVEQAQIFAERAWQREETLEARVRLAMRSALGRVPTSIRVAEAVEFVHTGARGLARDEGMPIESGERAVFADFCHVLFNLNEFVYRD